MLALVLGLALTLQPIVEAPELRASIERALPVELNRDVDDRLPRVTIDETGDVTVVFALRFADDIASVREAAAADTLTVLQTVYGSAEASKVSSVTVLGTFNVIGKRNTAREQPVLRAVASASRASALITDGLSAEALPAVIDTWWFHPGFTAEALRSQPSASRGGVIPVDAEGRPHQPLSLNEVRKQVDLMLLHLNEALFALSGNEIRVARSQFKQFFEEWDRAEEETSELYPAAYEMLDLELERAEIALLHRQPEDLNGARFALRALRTGLVEIATDLETR